MSLLNKTFARKGKGNGSPESSQVNGLSYDPTSKILTITYHGGKTYAYNDVPAELAQKAVEAESIGSFLAKNVKDKFPYRPLN